MLKIRTTGVEDYLDGSANIKALIIGGPGAGKTRMSSFWPKPIFIDAENGRGSLADRNMPFVEVKTSKDVLDALEYLKMLEKTPKVARQFQTVVFDTVDSFQRLVKDEWVQQTKAGSFTGYDAWGYLDTKMQMLFTRLLNLDYNVLVLVHFKDKTFKDGENTVREFTLQLQGAINDQIYNDFGLVGWLGTYWDTDGEGRVQKRGLTFTPTPQKPFLKDRFNVTPLWMPVTFDDQDYGQIFEAFFNRPEFEEFAESEVVGEIPDAERSKAANVQGPAEGGPLPVKPPAEVPLEKMLKGELDALARSLGMLPRGNMLKSELVTAIKAQQEKNAQAPADTPVETPTTDDAAGADDYTPAASPNQQLVTPTTDVPDLSTYTEPEKTLAEKIAPDPTVYGPRADQGYVPPQTPMEPTELETALGMAPPTSNGSSNGHSPAPAADAKPASPESSSATATSSGAEYVEDPVKAFAGVLEGLGGTVISHEQHDAPSMSPQPVAQVAPPVAAPAAKGPSNCADCGKDLAEEWADPTKKGYIRLSFVKFRRYLDTGCYAIAVNK